MRRFTPPGDGLRYYQLSLSTLSLFLSLSTGRVPLKGFGFLLVSIKIINAIICHVILSQFLSLFIHAVDALHLLAPNSISREDSFATINKQFKVSKRIYSLLPLPFTYDFIKRRIG